jgi:hypothetical protein
MHLFHSSDLFLSFLVVEFWRWVTNRLSGTPLSWKQLYQGLNTQVKVNTGGHRGLSKISRKEMRKLFLGWEYNRRRHSSNIDLRRCYGNKECYLWCWKNIISNNK